MKLTALKFDKKNANLGTDRGRKMLAESLKEYGAGRSILIDKNNRVIAGNKTLEQARAAGHKEIVVVKTDGKKLVAVQRVDLDLDDPKARALAIADNRVGELDLQWDPAVLQELGKDLDLSQFWSPGELADLFGDPAGTKVPEPKVEEAQRLLKKWGVKPGQLWHVGPHRLLCGDSLSQSALSRLMGDKRAQMAFTDPPWNVAIGERRPPKSKRRGILNDSMSSGQFAQFLKSAAANLAAAVTGDVYVVMGSGEWPAVDAALRGAGMHWSGTIVWVKDTFVLSRRQYHCRFEPIWYGWSAKSKSTYRGGRRQDDVWEFRPSSIDPALASVEELQAENQALRKQIDELNARVSDVWKFARPKRSVQHPTMKPPDLVRRAILNSSRPGDLVLDLFMGSGTTMATAESCGRTCFGCDLDPAYVAVTLERMFEMGVKPKAAGA